MVKICSVMWRFIDSVHVEFEFVEATSIEMAVEKALIQLKDRYGSVDEIQICYVKEVLDK